MVTYSGLRAVETSKPRINFVRSEVQSKKSPKALFRSLGYSTTGSKTVPRVGSYQMAAIKVNSSSYINEKLKLGLVDMGKLKNDWDTYGAKAPSLETINKAYEILNSIPFLISPEIFPERDGSIGLYWDEPSITRVVKIHSATFPMVQYLEEDDDSEKTFIYDFDSIINYLKIRATKFRKC